MKAIKNRKNRRVFRQPSNVDIMEDFLAGSGLDQPDEFVNASENDKRILLEIAARGMAQDNLHLKTYKDFLQVEAYDENGRPIIEKTFNIPKRVDKDLIHARFKDDILRVELPLLNRKDSSYIKIEMLD